MKNTYTFTARSAENPAHVATFTLHDDHMAVDIGTSLATAEKLLRNGDGDDGEGIDLKEAGTMLKPATAWLVQRALRPMSVADVTAEAADESLRVRAWIRARRRRLFPITLDWDHVDNPEASQAFAEEVHDRQASTDRPGRYPGPLDYWATWLAGAAVVGLMAATALRRLAGGNGTNGDA